MLRVLGRWLLYSLVGVVLVLMLLAGAGEGFGKPKGSLRSIMLSVAALLAALAGGLVLLSHRAGGSLGAYWPHASVVAWTLGAVITVTAWLSIARDLRRESAHRTARPRG